VFSPEVGNEHALFLLEDPEFAQQLGRLKPFHLVAKCGTANTSAGTIAFIIWSVSSRNGHVVDYEHFLDMFDPKTTILLRSIARQDRLKVIILDSFHSKTEGFFEFANEFGFGQFEAHLKAIRAGDTPADFAATQAALREEFSLEELKNA
jgi:hypothetical protein